MFVIKVGISVLIIFLSAYIGNLKAQNLKNREYILRDMVTFLELTKNEIVYMLSYLPNAYEISRQKLNSKLKDVIGKIVVDMLETDNSYIISQSIARNIGKIDELTEYDKSVISSTLNNLGRSDLESQKNIIQNSIKILENQIKEANEIKLNNTKMYRTIGVITGIMIVVVFI